MDVPKPINKNRLDGAPQRGTPKNLVKIFLLGAKKLSDKETILKEIRDLATAKEIKQTNLEEDFIGENKGS